MPLSLQHLLFLLSICTYVYIAEGSHFFGGTISWKRVDTNGPYDVLFEWRQGWRRGKGICGTRVAPCLPSMINTLVTNSRGDWTCSKGCIGTPVLANTNYWVTGVNVAEDWEQGVNFFSYVFPGNGKYEVSFKGGNWMYNLVKGGGTTWSVLTTIDLSVRDDTGVSNASPVSSSRPIYRLAYNCSHTIQIPILDPDFDEVLCRWATASNGVDECAGVCNALPSQYLDQKLCHLHLNLTTQFGYAVNSWYAVAIQIEDFPLTQITFGSTTKTPSDPLSSIPLQFLIYTPPLPCNAEPFFVTPTPAHGTVFYVPPNGTFAEVLQATNTDPTITVITAIYLIGPYGVMRTPLANASNMEESFIAITWTPTPDQYGVNLLCSHAENTFGVYSGDRCFVVRAGEYPPCDPSLDPCVYGTCDDSTGRAQCTCVPGYSGTICDQATSSSSSGGPDDWVWVLVGVLGAVALIAIITAIACCCCGGAAARRRRKKEEEEELEPDMRKKAKEARAKHKEAAAIAGVGGGVAVASLANDYRPSKACSNKHTKHHKHQEKDRKEKHSRNKKHKKKPSTPPNAVGPVSMEFGGPNVVPVEFASPPPQAMDPAVQMFGTDTWMTVPSQPVTPSGVTVGGHW